MSWLKDLVHPVTRLLSAQTGPLARFYPGVTDTATRPVYAGMDENYVEYRRDSLIRNCINTLAGFSTNRGFETIIEPENNELKQFIDQTNQKVNLDQTLFTAIIKAKTFGHTGFEIVLDQDQNPIQLLPLRSEWLKPWLDADWRLTSYSYRGVTDFYMPEKVLYFANNQLEADHVGLSDIEPIRDTVQTRRLILQEALKESSKVLWAGIGILRVDTGRQSSAQASKTIDDIMAQIKPGKYVGVNQKVEPQIINLDPKIQNLITELEYLDADIIGNFKVPRFLIGREKQFNRATAFAEAQMFINGPIMDIQRWTRRVLEKQWYSRLARHFLQIPNDQELPVTIKHRWNPIIISDFAELADTAAKLYMNGLGVLPREKAIELLGFDPAEVLKDESQPPQESASESADVKSS